MLNKVKTIIALLSVVGITHVGIASTVEAGGETTSSVRPFSVEGRNDFASDTGVTIKKHEGGRTYITFGLEAGENDVIQVVEVKVLANTAFVKAERVHHPSEHPFVTPNKSITISIADPDGEVTRAFDSDLNS